MNLFTGMTDRQILSSVLMFVLFNGYVVLTVVALAAFHVTSRPRRGRVRTAALWHFAALLLLMVSFISCVWAAPAEKSFIDPNNNDALFAGDRFIKVCVGLAFAAAAVACMLAGFITGARQKRAAAQAALLGNDSPAVGSPA